VYDKRVGRLITYRLNMENENNQQDSTVREIRTVGKEGDREVNQGIALAKMWSPVFYRNADAWLNLSGDYDN